MHKITRNHGGIFVKIFFTNLLTYRVYHGKLILLFTEVNVKGDFKQVNKGIKLFDSELRVMDLLWCEGELTALQIIAKLKDSIGWNRTTTYTIIRKCIEKGAVERIEPNFVCRALVSQNETQKFELEELKNKLFGGSRDLLVTALLNDEKLSDDEIKNLRECIKKFE